MLKRVAAAVHILHTIALRSTLIDSFADFASHTRNPRGGGGMSKNLRGAHSNKSSLFTSVPSKSGGPLSGIYILKKIRNYTKTEIQNGETLPKLNIGI